MTLRFKMTCSACPEQYDILTCNDETIGYARLRHGFFYVSCPGVGGKTVYEAYPKGDGCFDDAQERDYHLRFATKAVEDWLAAGRPSGDVPPPPAPDASYVLEDFSDPWN